jgi:hypothetical protein
MSIIVEEERKKVNWFSLFAVIVIAGVLFAGVYFLLFQKPELIEIVLPSELQGISSISRLSFDPEGIMDSAAFKSLRRYGSNVQSTQTPGRENPFRPFAE